MTVTHAHMQERKSRDHPVARSARMPCVSAAAAKHAYKRARFTHFELGVNLAGSVNSKLLSSQPIEASMGHHCPPIIISILLDYTTMLVWLTMLKSY